jgi:beta-glucosidase
VAKNKELHMKRLCFGLWMLALCAPNVGISQAQTSTQPPYLNTKFTIEERVKDLIGRMTLEEEVSQMQNHAPAIPRLGIPEYDWWNEALHGVARAGVATVFPQAIGLAASWDTDLMLDVSTVISEEARAKYNEAIRNDQHGIYQGLTFWSPNINIFRDPRWGRGQETYGEDPYLTGRLGVSFVRGMQGDDPRYFKTISTPKHFAVHSGPEQLRHKFDVPVDERDLRETYLPAFEACVREGKAFSIMCAYNAYAGEPCCSNDYFLTKILRKEWGFQGYVVSDCGAISDIYAGHRKVPSAPEASAAAVRAGCELSCGDEYASLVQAVARGLLQKGEVDEAARRLFTARFRLGMFDPPDMVPFSRIPISVNDNKQHRELALKAARESIVLLKNEGNVLPLNNGLKRIAVIGPNADDVEILLGNYNGTPSQPVTPLQGIRNKVDAKTEVIFAKGCSIAEGLWDEARPVPALCLGQGLKGEYFANMDLAGKPVITRTDPQVDFNWGTGSPDRKVPADSFSVRWTGKMTAPKTGEYRVGATVNNGCRLWVDDVLVVDDWKDAGPRTLMKELRMRAGKSYSLKLEFFERVGEAEARLVWVMPGTDLQAEAVDVAEHADAVVLCLGLSPRLEGEEMDVRVEGFSGGDRLTLDLPKIQESLLRAIDSLKKPTVVVLMNGSAVSVNWADAHVPAIVEAWYPGEEAGDAIADVIFGNYNPGGRLPVTFYRSVDQLPPFEDYRMAGRTYRYSKEAPLYPFGHGLSYTRFAYSGLVLDKQQIHGGDSLRVSVTVKNAGGLDGDEVVQLYLTDEEATVSVPVRSLQGFRRVHLAAGQSDTVSFILSPRQMSLIDAQMQRVIEPGYFTVAVGGKQPDLKGTADSRTTEVVKVRFEVAGAVTPVRN